jgi:LmbE family N-acetylglucosaminyl deacetylase
VVVTFGPEGSYGHPDHIAISQLTSAAVICAADNSFLPGPTAPHRVDKFYYVVDTLEMVEWVKTEFGGIHFEIDGVKRDHTGWKDWAITTRIDSRNYWETVVEAIRCHQSQLPAMPGLLEMTPEQHQLIWGTGNFYRVFSLVNGGRKRETDIFEGLR